jgi:hypothetical protein
MVFLCLLLIQNLRLFSALESYILQTAARTSSSPAASQHSTFRTLLRVEKNPFSPSFPPRLPSQGKRNWNLFTEATVSSLFQFPSKIDALVFLLSSQLPSPWGHLAAVSIHYKAGRQRNCGLEINISKTEFT